MKHFLILIITCLLVLTTRAQKTDSIRYIYNNQTIYRYGGYFMKGTERLRFNDLQMEFSMSELGLAGYIKSKKYKTTGMILSIASILTSLGSLSVIANHGNRNTAYTLLVGQLVLSLGARKYSLLSAQSLDRSLWQRNKDILFPNR